MATTPLVNGVTAIVEYSVQDTGNQGTIPFGVQKPFQVLYEIIKPTEVAQRLPNAILGLATVSGGGGVGFTLFRKRDVALVEMPFDVDDNLKKLSGVFKVEFRFEDTATQIPPAVVNFTFKRNDRKVRELSDGFPWLFLLSSNDNNKLVLAFVGADNGSGGVGDCVGCTKPATDSLIVRAKCSANGCYGFTGAVGVGPH